MSAFVIAALLTATADAGADRRNDGRVGPFVHEERMLSIDVPESWRLEYVNGHRTGRNETALRISAAGGAATLMVELAQRPDGPAGYLDAVRAGWRDSGFVLVPRDEIDTWAGRNGLGATGVYGNKGDRFDYTLFAQAFSDWWVLGMRGIVAEDANDELRETLQSLAASLEFTTDPHGLPPALETPSRSEVGLVSFDYPSNWALPDEGGTRQLYAGGVAIPQDGFFQAAVYNTDAEPAAEVEATKQLLENEGFLFGAGSPIDRLGPIEGVGTDWPVVVADGLDTYRCRVLIRRISEREVVEIREVVPTTAAETIEPGLELIRSSLRAVPLDEATPAIEPPARYESDWIGFDHPRNWLIVGEADERDITIYPPQLGSLRAFRYQTDRSADAELDVTVGSFLEDHEQLGEPTHTEAFGGVAGAGRVIRLRDGDGDELVLTAFVVMVAEGEAVEIHQRLFDVTADTVAPGFDLIAATLGVAETKAAEEAEHEGRPTPRRWVPRF